MKHIHENFNEKVVIGESCWVTEQNQNAQFSKFRTCIYIENTINLFVYGFKWALNARFIRMLQGFQHNSNKWNIAKVSQKLLEKLEREKEKKQQKNTKRKMLPICY